MAIEKGAPTDGIVRTGHVYHLAQSLQAKLGRRVVVHRVVNVVYLNSSRTKRKQTIRYSLGIEGSQPSVFFNMTIDECKSRLAMILDLLHSGVVRASETKHSDGPDIEQNGPHEGDSSVEHQPPDDDKPY